MMSDKPFNFIETIQATLKDYPDWIHVENNYNEERIHQILESEAMDISGFVKLSYSRRPSLQHSYSEAGKVPYILVNKEHTFLGVISEIQASWLGKKEKLYYSSDLRITPKASWKVRKEFREIYSKIIKQLPRPCLTVILKKNIKAMLAFSKRNTGIIYDPLYEYTTRSFLILPTLKLMKMSSFDKLYRIEKGNTESHDYISKKVASSLFAHSSAPESRHYVIKKNEIIKGVFSLRRPKHQSFLISPQSKSSNLWFKLAKKFFKRDFSKKMSWVYLTNLILDDDMPKSLTLESITCFLYKTNQIKTGDVFLICHPKDGSIKMSCLCPQFLTDATIFEVASKANKYEEQKNCYLDPIQL